jgi:hypothetical protein
VWSKFRPENDHTNGEGAQGWGDQAALSRPAGGEVAGRARPRIRSRGGYHAPVRHVVDPQTGQIDYDQAIAPDAEDLAETGVKDAYDEDIAPHLLDLGVVPAQVHELSDEAQASYVVECAGVRYEISGPDIPDVHTWGRATFALFDIVNRQLDHLDVKLYALNGGNDLFGVFMTPDEAEVARRALNKKSDWPYIVTPDPESNGMYFD